uniref:Uncharacterized protein n=1 Tax=Anguilla anguilla TaxID=7936 RepID=A0A0E9WBP6_ANGAN
MTAFNQNTDFVTHKEQCGPPAHLLNGLCPAAYTKERVVYSCVFSSFYLCFTGEKNNGPHSQNFS